MNTETEGLQSLKAITLNLITTLIDKKDMEDPTSIVGILKTTPLPDEVVSSSPDSSADLNLFLSANISEVVRTAVNNHYLFVLKKNCRKYIDLYLQFENSKPTCPHIQLCCGFVTELNLYLEKNDLFQYELKESYNKKLLLKSKDFLQTPVSFISEAMVELLWKDTTFLRQYRFLLSVYSYEAPGILTDSITMYIKSI
jgi:hypothetical protein